MKIDDPKVQAYILGQLSEVDEAALLEKLQSYPEVSDLAETLKRTQKLINQDKSDGSVPEIAQEKVDKELSPIDSSSLRSNFESILGQNWKVELGLISGTVAVLFLIVIIVPVLKSLSNKTSEKQSSQFQKKTLEAMESKKGEAGVIRESDSSAGSQDSGISERFESDIRSGTSSPRDILTQSLSSGYRAQVGAAEVTAPVQVDFVQGASVAEAIRRGEKLKATEFDLSGFVNSFAQIKTQAERNSVAGPNLLLELEGSLSPWGEGYILTSTLVAIGQDGENLPTTEKQSLFLGLPAGLRSFFEAESNLSIHSELESALAAYTGEAERNWLVVYLGVKPSPEQALRLKRWSLKPGSKLSVVDVTGKFRELVRGRIGPETKVEYVAASTPFMLKKAFFNYLAGEEGPIHQIRLRLVSADPSQFQVSLVGAAKTKGTGRQENLSGAWMFPGERVTQVFVVSSVSAQEFSLDEKILGVNLNYILAEELSPVRGLSSQILLRDFSGEISSLHRQAVALAWMGLIMKGELDLTDESYNKLEGYIAPLKSAKIFELHKLVGSLYLP